MLHLSKEAEKKKKIALSIMLRGVGLGASQVSSFTVVAVVDVHKCKPIM